MAETRKHRRTSRGATQTRFDIPGRSSAISRSTSVRQEISEEVTRLEISIWGPKPACLAIAHLACRLQEPMTSLSASRVSYSTTQKESRLCMPTSRTQRPYNLQTK